MQADGSALAVVVSDGTQDVTLWRRPAGGTGWTPITSPHPSNGVGNAVVAASRTGDKVAWIWTEEPANTTTDAYRVFAQVGTASDLGAATALPNQPTTPGGGNNHNESPTIAVDPNGNAVALWNAHRSTSPPAGSVFAAAFAGSDGPPPVDPTPPTGPTDPSNPSNDPVNDLLGLDPDHKIKVGNGTIDAPVFCSPALPNPCTGNIVGEVGGSYSPGRLLAKKPKKFSFKVGPVPFSVAPGESATVKLKLSKKALKTVKKALKKKGKATLTIQATLGDRKGEKIPIKLKR
jgi:hypothetical protein